MQTARYADGSSAGSRNVYAALMQQNQLVKTADYVLMETAVSKKGWSK